MRITVFGVTDATGGMVVRGALDRGWQVTVYGRSPARFGLKHEKLRVINGALDDTELIAKAVKGSRAAISLLSPQGMSKGMPMSKATERILAALQEHKVKRFICVSTPSVTDREDSFDIRFKLAVALTRLTVPLAHGDIVRTATAVRGSELDWTIVRLPKLTDKPASGELRVGYLGKGVVRLFSLSRPSLAEFLLDQVTDDTYVHKAPAISN